MDRNPDKDIFQILEESATSIAEFDKNDPHGFSRYGTLKS